MRDRTLAIRMLLLFFILAALAQFSFADDITFSLNQSEYYFLVGEDAVIPLTINNTYSSPISGMLSYSLTQEINQAGFQYSSSNSQSKSLTAQQGTSNIGISFGTSNTPSILKIGLSFDYNDGKEQRVIDLDNITVHFVSDQSQKQSKKKQVQSSSEKRSANKQRTNPLSQQQQSMQQMINQMLGNQPQTQQQMQNQLDSQHKLQNNQMAQDSNALKKQMEKQLKQQQEMKKEFQKNLAKNNDFQKKHQELLNQGYNITSDNLNPSSNNTGSFEMQYQNKKGESATLSGEMKNGTMKRLDTFTPQDKKELIRKLEQDNRFKKYDEQLKKEGFEQQDAQITHQQNNSEVVLNYQNRNNETAEIKARFADKNITDVKLQKEDIERTRSWLWLWLFLIPLLAIAAYLVYIKYHKKPINKEKEPVVVNEPFDHIAESNKLLKIAEQLFDKKQYKDAYGKAGQALRLYLSYENKLNKELTNDDIINHLKKNRKHYKDVKACFDLCSLVEFARYKANSADFIKIISYAKKIINQR